jgi:hypothetical protein
MLLVTRLLTKALEQENRFRIAAVPSVYLTKNKKKVIPLPNQFLVRSIYFALFKRDITGSASMTTCSFGLPR